jgi:polyisoprenyl-phosphate glycosyltransferase
MRNKSFKVSVVIPAYNEEGNFEQLTGKLVELLSKYPSYEILFVDDGSEDNTLAILQDLHRRNPRIRYLSLSRNFGHQNALKAGLDHAVGDCVITMDADLQHPPRLIPRFVDKWQAGFDIVTTIRKDDRRVFFLKRLTSGIFYRLMNRLADIHIPKGAADFRLLDRAVVDVLKDTKEYYLFFRGLISWVGFKQCALQYVPEERFAGQTKYSLKRMLGFALTGFTSFSLKPLRLSVLLGLFFAVLAFVYGIYAILLKFFTDQAIPGWASVLVSVLFIGGFQLIVLGIIGEYIGKLFMESKQRPHYIVKETSRPFQKEEPVSKSNHYHQGQKFKNKRHFSKSTYNRENSSIKNETGGEKKDGDSPLSHRGAQRYTRRYEEQQKREGRQQARGYRKPAVKHDKTN